MRVVNMLDGKIAGNGGASYDMQNPIKVSGKRRPREKRIESSNELNKRKRQSKVKAGVKKEEDLKKSQDSRGSQ
ncbi:hypothetical protein BC939DRAFT_435899 [Gamsiella multidivaricata]|uniref:uncharacterized protein n=1 Tax=Gamsiella multidivaricata TaxID=101098 RepID=UPI00221FA762|nr:uncharacterized protein BC939DRAFT_435899 [Gamsiella multidivaricata]KAI7831653.1 hypothetical protein BC939DRAFT_435899 [Gamsiella multidivaricata]